MAEITMSEDKYLEVYTLHGLAIDTRLTVFGTKFHVHSFILKVLSEYFRKFLGSPDKTPATAGGTFRDLDDKDW
jgi:hypothetical protein